MDKVEKIKKCVEESYPGLLKQTFDDNLLSIMLYGSYVSGDFIPGLSDVNILVILENPAPDGLGLLGISGHRMMRNCRITPLIMTRTEFIRSADVFPMEYYDIRNNSRVLFGSDETEALSLTKKNLRHQLEERLRGTTASLRQVIIASRGKKKVLGAGLKGIFGSLKALFRNLLRLKSSEEIPAGTEETIRKLGSVFDIDVNGFQKLLALRKGEKLDVGSLAAEVLDSLQKLVSAVDAMEFGD